MQQIVKRSPVMTGERFLRPIEDMAIKRRTLMVSGSRQGDRHYGVVTKVKTSQGCTEIKIGWYGQGDRIEDQSWYSQELLKYFDIRPLPLILPGKSLVKIPRRTLLLLEDGTIYNFATEAYFFVVGATATHYYAFSQEDPWLLPIADFPGIPVACRLDLTAQKRLMSSKLALQAINQQKDRLASISYQIGAILLELIPNLETTLELKGIKQECQEIYPISRDFPEIVEMKLQEAINHRKSQGVEGLKEGDRLIQLTLNPDASRNFDYRFGTLTAININPLCFEVKWDFWDAESSPNDVYYSAYELGEDGIERLDKEVFNEHIYLEYSESKTYFNVAIGFSSKQKGNSWLRPIKKEIGYLGGLHPSHYDFSRVLGLFHHELSYKNGDKFFNHAHYFYLKRPKHITFNGFFRNLEKLKKFDFDTALPRRNRIL